MFELDRLSAPTAELVAAVEAAVGATAVDGTAAGGGRAGSSGPGDAALADLRGLLWCHKRLEALVAERLAAAADRDLAQLEGWPRLSAWAEAELLMDRHHVNALLRAGRIARQLPAVAQTWRDGGLSTSHVHAAGQATEGMPEQACARADDFLAKQAGAQTVPEFRETCAHLRETLVPELVADELERLRDASHVSLRQVPGGLRISGVLAGDLAERVAAGLDRFSRRLPDDHRDAALRRAEGLALGLGIAAQADLAARDLDGSSYAPADVPAVRVQTIVDVRSLQRALDRDAQRTGAAHGPDREAQRTPPAHESDRDAQRTAAAHGPDRAAVDVETDPPVDVDVEPSPRTLADLVRGAVGERSRVPVDWRSLVRQVCHGELQRLVLGAASEPLDLGRKVRLFSAAQRQALLAGRGHCQWQHCTSPWVEADHITGWHAGGGTDLDEGRMLCEYHHRLRHLGWTLVRCHDGSFKPTPPPDWAYQLALASRMRAVSQRCSPERDAA